MCGSVLKCPGTAAGTGTAADGLSRFDLTRFNPWYFERICEFGLSDENGLVLYHNLYNTHNVLEILPHWVDYPWRPANNINDTGCRNRPPSSRAIACTWPTKFTT